MLPWIWFWISLHQTISLIFAEDMELWWFAVCFVSFLDWGLKDKLKTSVWKCVSFESGTLVHWFEASFNVLGPLFGLPFVTGSLPHSPQFVLSLAERDEDQQITRVRENRLAPLLCYLMMLSWSSCNYRLTFLSLLIWRYLENLASVRLPFTHLDDKLTCVKERTTEKCEQNTPWQHDFTVLQYPFIEKSVQNSGLVCRYWLPHSCNRCPKPQSSARWFLWVLLAHGQSHVVWMFDPLPTDGKIALIFFKISLKVLLQLIL